MLAARSRSAEQAVGVRGDPPSADGEADAVVGHLELGLGAVAAPGDVDLRWPGVPLDVGDAPPGRCARAPAPAGAAAGRLLAPAAP